MAGGKLTPRQKMINMMYLVLTALLAMNVSAEVLEAFKLVESGIKNSNDVLVDKIGSVDAAFQSKLGEDPDAEELYDMANQITAITEDLYNYIDGLKETLKSDGFAGSREDGELEKLDDIDSPTRLLAEPGPDFKGEELQTKINEARDQIIAILNSTDKFLESDRQTIIDGLTLAAPNNEDIPTSDPKHFWYYKNFFHVPAAGTMTILTKMQNDVLSAQASANEGLYKTIGALTIKFDKLRAAIQAEKAYLPGGAEYKANIFLTASSSGIKAETFTGKLDMSKFKPDTAVVDGFLPYIGSAEDESDNPFTGDYNEVEGGQYSRTAAVGVANYEGAVRIKNPKGEFEWYPFFGSFEGAAPGGFSVSPTKMNVLYIGVDNPLSITLGDAKPGTERVSISQGSISGSGNSWTARVSKVGEAKITVGGTTPSGEAAKSQSANFRVKLIPDPIPTLGGDEVLTLNGKGQKGTLKAKGGIVPLLKDFDFEARFNVISYDFYLTSGGELLPARGNSGPGYSGSVSNLLDRAKPKDLVVFDNIKVQGPDGKTRKIPSMTFQII